LPVVSVSFAMLLVLFRLLSVSWGKAIFFAVAATLATDYVFRSLLLVPLPFGVMPRLPW
jgi:putative tricarboxylic transport membrane protein